MTIYFRSTETRPRCISCYRRFRKGPNTLHPVQCSGRWSAAARHRCSRAPMRPWTYPHTASNKSRQSIWSPATNGPNRPARSTNNSHPNSGANRRWSRNFCAPSLAGIWRCTSQTRNCRLLNKTPAKWDGRRRSRKWSKCSSSIAGTRNGCGISKRSWKKIRIIYWGRRSR